MGLEVKAFRELWVYMSKVSGDYGCRGPRLPGIMGLDFEMPVGHPSTAQQILHSS